MGRILLIDDSLDSQFLVKTAIGSRHQITAVERASDALAEVARNKFDLIILDIGLPDQDGFHLCAELRSKDSTRLIPVIFVTGRTEISDKILGFSLGAEDYIVKPFHPLELRARVEARLARSSEAREQDELYSVGGFVIKVSLQKVFLVEGDREVDLGLPPVEFRLFRAFALHEGAVLSRSQLLSAVWGENSELVDRSIDKHVSVLRRKLRSSNARIETVPRLGYRFTLAEIKKKSA